MSGPYMVVHDVVLRAGGCGTAVWQPTGAELGSTSGGRPASVPAFLVLEALAQCAGRTLVARDLGSGEWLLATIQDAEVEAAVRWDDRVELKACVVRTAASFAVVDTRAMQHDTPVGRARVMLVRSPN